MEDEDEFFDTNSLASYISVGKRRQKDNGYLSLSRNTIYHSAVDLEMESLEPTVTKDDQYKVSNNNKTVTYSEWKDRTWRCFTKSDLVVDFVLAYEDDGNIRKAEVRDVFEKRLEDIGLILERESCQKISFVKIHAPHEVLCTYAEILKLRMPIRDDSRVQKEEPNLINSMVNKALDYMNVKLDEEKFPPEKYVLQSVFSREKDYLFDTKADHFFTTSIRIAVVWYILEREKFSVEEHDTGIKKLISDKIYKAAYPLHDGDLYTEGSQRQLLFHEWASVSKWIKFQPIDNVKEYFGVKLALYFSWLGFYTHMLIPAAFIGICCILYGVITLPSDILSQDICKSSVLMCPLCDRNCDYWRLSDTCTNSKIIYVIDNPATIFFAVFMSFWAALYLELWKRYSAEVTHRWGLTGFDVQCEPPRPEYLRRLAKTKKRKVNVVTQVAEPVVPFWRVKLPTLILSFTVAIFWVCLAIGIVFGIVIYRMTLLASDKLYAEDTIYYTYIMPVTAAVLNLICIMILNFFYTYLAERLTELELQRTQTEYDDSLALKIYMFQFVNYYSCIFYIAFVKGKFVGYPAKYNRIFGYRQEECSPGGCLLELTIQLAIIMIGKQALNSALEMITPFLKKMYNSFQVSTGMKKRSSEEHIICCNQWTEDYTLSDLEPQGLFNEYLEMVLQYGFVTIFVTAFPLAPLFALINNILEMRLDAQKIIKYYRRPVPQRVKNIGIWMPVMDVLGRISVVSNAFIIAFSSHFIPQLVYYLRKGGNRDMNGYLDFSLSRFDVRHFLNGTGPERTNFNVSECYYTDYRHSSEHNYHRPVEYWHIMAARLAFVVVYQNLVGFVISAVQWVIPDVPKKLSDQIKREEYRTNETIIKHETDRAKKLRGSTPNINSIPGLFPETNGDLHLEGPSNVHFRGNPRNSLYHDVIDS
uniref:Anoctamin n=2 Tax=Photinus pyralis TaxID=7054 RepID=A0A1Y1MA25_PHOPY